MNKADFSVEILVGTDLSNGKGTWIDLMDHANLNSFMEECREIYGEDPHFLFLDVECPSIIKNFNMISKHWINEKIFNLIAKFKNAPHSIWVYEADQKKSGIRNLRELFSHVERHYYGHFRNKIDFAYAYAQREFDAPPYLVPYIDYDKLGDDLMDSFYEENDYYFSREALE